MNTISRVLPAVAVAATTAFATISPAAATSTDSYESQVVDRTNDKRADHDLVAVKAQSCVDRWAEGQARWMAKNHKLEHRKGRLGKIMDDCNLNRASENIAYGYSSGNRTVTAWMKSPGHRANILDKKMRYIGVGAVQDDDGTWWVAQVFGAKS